MVEVTGKTAAAAALKAMVEDRKTLVEALGEAVDHHRRAADAVTAAQQTEADAAETVRTAYTAALDGGWTTTMLKDAGLKAPKAPRQRRSAPVEDPLVGTGVADNLVRWSQGTAATYQRRPVAVLSRAVVAADLLARAGTGFTGRTGLLVPWTPSQQLVELDRRVYGPMCGVVGGLVALHLHA